MKNFARVSAVAGAAFALLFAAPALAQADEGDHAPTCDLVNGLSGSATYDKTIKIDDVCHDADGDDLLAVSIVHATAGADVTISEDGKTVDVHADNLLKFLEYSSLIAVTDGTDTINLRWATILDPRGTTDVKFLTAKDGETGFKGGLLADEDPRPGVLTFSLDKVTLGTGKVKISPDGTVTWTRKPGDVFVDFTFLVSQKTSHNGTVTELREAEIQIERTPEPTRPAETKPAANGKEALAQTGSPAPMIAGVGAGAMALGGGALWLTRRRRSAA